MNTELSAILTAVVSFWNLRTTSWQTDQAELPMLDLHRLLYGTEDDARATETSKDAVEAFAQTMSA